MPKEAKRDRPIPPWKPEHRGRRLTNDFEAGIVRLEPRTTKNDEGRAFPFDALPALKRLLEKQRNRTKALERATGRIIPHVFHRDMENPSDTSGAHGCLPSTGQRTKSVAMFGKLC